MSNIHYGISQELVYEQYPALEEKIKQGDRLHAFRSGGGLRVVFLANKGRGPCSSNNNGYGEHPNIEMALKLAEHDCVNHLPYNEVYGKLIPNFWTGTTVASSPLDRWILSGHAFDISYNDGFVFEGDYYHQFSEPKEVLEKLNICINVLKELDDLIKNTKDVEKEKLYMQAKALLLPSRKIVYEEGGLTYESYIVRYGDYGITTKCIHRPEGRVSFIEQRVLIVTGGDTLFGHLKSVNETLADFFVEQDKKYQ